MTRIISLVIYISMVLVYVNGSGFGNSIRQFGKSSSCSSLRYVDILAEAADKLDNLEDMMEALSDKLDAIIVSLPEDKSTSNHPTCSLPDPSGPLTNIARGKSTYQVSTHSTGGSYRAVDGNADPLWGGGSCTHTGLSQNAWWKVDLEGLYYVHSVKITNRQDCCSTRITNAEVRAGLYSDIHKNTKCGAIIHSSVASHKEFDFKCESPVLARYVSVQLKDRKDYLQLCEVEVFGQESGLENVALGKAAWQSTTYKMAHAGRAVDGVPFSHYGDMSCTHSHLEHDPWWRVDLGKEYCVRTVIVTNRKDCCSERLLNVEVRVGNTVEEAKQCGSLVSSTTKNDETLVFECGNSPRGQYVQAQIQDRKDYLQLCEVAVYAVGSSPDETLVNVAAGKPATQSSIHGGYGASKAVDGDTNSQWSGGSCMHTGIQADAWWKVDLGGLYQVHNVIVTNRMDCCHTRLLNAQVRVGPYENIGYNTRCGANVDAGLYTKETINFNCIGVIEGRYVSIQLAGRTDYLHVCEVQVMAPDRSFTNMALEKPTSESSVYPGTNAAVPELAVDGNTDSNWGGSSCTHTNNDINAWWRVDLGYSHDIHSVMVTNRQDCCDERFDGAVVLVGEAENVSDNKQCGLQVNWEIPQVRQIYFLCMAETKGRYVGIQLKDHHNYLHVCEVEVYGE